MPQNIPSSWLCSSPNQAPAQTMSLFTISHHGQVSLGFRNRDCGKEVTGRCEVRMRWSKSGASNWDLLTNLVIQTQFRNWGFLQLHQHQLALIWSSQCGSTENLTERTEHNPFHDNCAYRRHHTSQGSMRYKLCRRTTETQRNLSGWAGRRQWA